jgi:hypothetical protein
MELLTLAKRVRQGVALLDRKVPNTSNGLIVEVA